MDLHRRSRRRCPLCDRRAAEGAFTPHPTFAAVGQLVVVLNPEHSLGITDLAGNPVGRRYSL